MLRGISSVMEHRLSGTQNFPSVLDYYQKISPPEEQPDEKEMLEWLVRMAVLLEESGLILSIPLFSYPGHSHSSLVSGQSSIGVVSSYLLSSFFPKIFSPSHMIGGVNMSRAWQYLVSAPYVVVSTIEFPHVPVATVPVLGGKGNGDDLESLLATFRGSSYHFDVPAVPDRLIAQTQFDGMDFLTARSLDGLNLITNLLKGSHPHVIRFLGAASPDHCSAVTMDDRYFEDILLPGFQLATTKEIVLRERPSSDATDLAIALWDTFTPPPNQMLITSPPLSFSRKPVSAVYRIYHVRRDGLVQNGMLLSDEELRDEYRNGGPEGVLRFTCTNSFWALVSLERGIPVVRKLSTHQVISTVVDGFENILPISDEPPLQPIIIDAPVVPAYRKGSVPIFGYRLSSLTMGIKERAALPAAAGSPQSIGKQTRWFISAATSIAIRNGSANHLPAPSMFTPGPYFLYDLEDICISVSRGYLYPVGRKERLVPLPEIANVSLSLVEDLVSEKTATRMDKEFRRARWTGNIVVAVLTNLYGGVGEFFDLLRREFPTIPSSPGKLEKMLLEIERNRSNLLCSICA